MLSSKSILFVFLCFVAAGNASLNNVRQRLRGQAEDDIISGSSSYEDLLSNMDESTIQKIHQRYLSEKAMEAEEADRELQVEEGSMSLSMSMSLSLSMSMSLQGVFLTAETSVVAAEAEAETETVAETKTAKKEKSPKEPKTTKRDRRQS